MTPQGAPKSPVIFTMVMELVLRDLIKSWITRKLAWKLDDFALAAICHADDVVLVAVTKSTWLLEWNSPGRMVLRDVQNGSLEKWCESVGLECVWKRVFVAVFAA